MKKMKLTIVLLLVTFAVAFCQPDKVFKEQITVEKGIKYGDGTIQLTAGGGGGSMVYPPAGIPLSTGTAWGTSIVNNSANWNTAYSWGNHAGLYSLLNHNHSTLYKPISYTPTWAEITGKPLTFPSDWNTTANKPGEVELNDAIKSLPGGSPILILTQTQINALIIPAGESKIVLNSTENVMQYWTGTVWKKIAALN